MTRSMAAGATAALGGALVFALEPLVARRLLPALGGSAQVWCTCVLFFQLAVLAATALAMATARCGRRAQMLVHAALVIVPALGLSRLSELAAVAPPGESPEGWLLARLVSHAGAVVVALCASGAVLQQWAADGHAASGIYAASNAGSLAGLFAYPFLVEPAWGLARQQELWNAGYVWFAVAFCAAAWWTPAGAVLAAPEELDDLEAEPPLGGPLAWLLAAAVPASLSLSVTSHLAHEVPAAPVFWVFPLGAYLFGFILAFSTARRWRGLVRGLEALAIAVLCIELFVPVRLAGFSLHLWVLFSTSFLAHARLADAAPAPEHRGGFVLTVAAGGALGGLFNALIAPRVFPAALEYPLALVLACALRPRFPGDRLQPRDAGGPLLLGAVTAGTMLALPHVGDVRDVAARVAVLFIAAATALLFRRRAMRFALAIGCVLACAFGAFQLDGTLWMARSAYGVSRITREPRRLVLWHGSTIHGGAETGPDGRPRGIAYHAPESPLGTLLARPGPPRRIAIVGLGAGAIAAFARPGDVLRFYELDPVVAEMAAHPSYFRFLATCRGTVDVVQGDGRQALASEPAGAFDLVLLDAFTSDAVPVHLLTTEALALYRARLAPGGLIVFNTANRHLDLASLVASLARAANLPCRATPGPDLDPTAATAGTWAALAPLPGDLDRWLGPDPRWKPAAATTAPAWTDDHASPLSILR